MIKHKHYWHKRAERQGTVFSWCEKCGALKEEYKNGKIWYIHPSKDGVKIIERKN